MDGLTKIARADLASLPKGTQVVIDNLLGDNKGVVVGNLSSYHPPIIFVDKPVRYDEKMVPTDPSEIDGFLASLKEKDPSRIVVGYNLGIPNRAVYRVD